MNQNPVGLFHHVMQSEGMRGLFRGNTADVLRKIPQSSVQFFTSSVTGAREVHANVMCAPHPLLTLKESQMKC